MKKVCSVLLVLAMLLTALPMDVFHLHTRAASVSDLSYSLYDDYVVIDSCDSAASGKLSIPSEIEGLPVTGISGAAFYGCSQLTSITIPNTVTEIGSSAFSGCSRLHF